MASLFEGTIEMKGNGKNWIKAYGVLVRGKIDLYSDRRKSALVHTIVLSPQASYKDGKKKLYFSISNGEFTENHFRVDSKGDKEQWKEYIYLALSPERNQGGSRTLPSPGRKGGALTTPPSYYSTEFQKDGSQGVYDDCCVERDVRFLNNQGGSPIDDSDVDSGGTQFSEKGRSDDGVVRHRIPRSGVSYDQPKSAGNSPYTSPGCSADGQVQQLDKYQWYLGKVGRDDVDEIFKEVEGQVFGVRFSRGCYVISLRKKDGSSMKIFHHKILQRDNKYFIDGITTFSGNSILNLLEEFLKTFPGILPLGGRLDRLKGGQEDDPAYDYAWNPDEMAGMIQQKLRMQPGDDDGGYVHLKKTDPSSESIPSPGRGRGPPPVIPTKPQAKGKSPQPQEPVKPRANFANELQAKLGKKAPAPKPKPPTTQPVSTQKYSNHPHEEEGPIYGNVDFPGAQAYENTEVRVTSNGRTQERPRPSQRQNFPQPDEPDEDLYVAPDNEQEELYVVPNEEEQDIYMVPDGEEEEMYVAVDDESEEHIYVQDQPQPPYGGGMGRIPVGGGNYPSIGGDYYKGQQRYSPSRQIPYHRK